MESCWVLIANAKVLLTYRGPFSDVYEMLMDHWVATWYRPYLEACPSANASSMFNLSRMVWRDSRRGTDPEDHRNAHHYFEIFRQFWTKLLVNGTETKPVLDEEWYNNPCKCRHATDVREVILETFHTPEGAARKEDPSPGPLYRIVLTSVLHISRPMPSLFERLPPKIMEHIDKSLPEEGWDKVGWTEFSRKRLGLDEDTCRCCKERQRDFVDWTVAPLCCDCAWPRDSPSPPKRPRSPEAQNSRKKQRFFSFPLPPCESSSDGEITDSSSSDSD